jgi:hypothetical protein
MPLDATISVNRVIEITDPHQVTATELRRHKVESGERILLRTSNSARC